MGCNIYSMKHNIGQELGCPLVKTFFCNLGCNQCRAVNHRGHAEQQFAGGRLFGLDTLLLAVTDEVFDCSMKLRMKLICGFTVEADDRSGSQDAPDKNVVSVVDLDAGGVALVGHGVHGRASTRSRRSRTSST